MRPSELTFLRVSKLLLFSLPARKSAPDNDLVHYLHLVRREHANPLQFLVGEVPLFLVAGSFYLPQSRFLRDTAELRFRYAEHEGSSCLRDIFRNLIVHNLPLCLHVGHGVFFHSHDHRLVTVGVGRSVPLPGPPPP